jgi:hypothetical protein
VSFIIDAASLSRLNSLTDAVMIGVLHRTNATIYLFEAAAVTDVVAQRFAGHVELVRHSDFAASDLLGFSLHIKNRAVQAFYRTSVLNRDFEDFAIPRDMMSQVLSAIGLVPSPQFRSYPPEDAA